MSSFPSDLYREASSTRHARFEVARSFHKCRVSLASTREISVPAKTKTINSDLTAMEREFSITPARYRNSVPFNRARNFTRNDCQRPRSQRRTCATSAETKAPDVRRCNIWLQLPLFDYTTVRGVNFPRQLKWLLPS